MPLLSLRTVLSIVVATASPVWSFAPQPLIPSLGTTTTTTTTTTTGTTTSTSLPVFNFGGGRPASSTAGSGCTPLPRGISPFEKSVSKSLDVQADFRKLALPALERAVVDGQTLLELEFPPLIGNAGLSSKSQFDDFDNLQELDANRDWCVQWAPEVLGRRAAAVDRVWLVFPDDKECELARKEWGGQRYRGTSCKFTSIRAAATAVADNDDSVLAKAWGSTLASTVDKLQGGDGILADSSTLDDLTTDTNNNGSTRRLHLVCQPGNGGPVEDWINVETLHRTSEQKAADASIVTCVVNGALDKVRDGYYPGLFFPALAKTKPFYDRMEAVLFLKPVSDKGLYGWIFRVYPEPWQVILQTAVRKQQPGRTEETVEIQERVALVSETRPTYQQAIQAMVQTAAGKN